jgi:putative endopeptidase
MARELAKIGKPVDKEDWFTSPMTVNAYYEPWTNRMVFPAGILQSPFFSSKSGSAANFGAFGTFAGHEITHGFDDQGSKFGGDGSLTNWWAPETLAKFRAKTECLRDQYSAYEVLPQLKVNGALTLGENIADAGGLKLALRAYRARYSGSKGQTVAGGFSEDQQFFLAFGQAWCSKETEERSRLAVLTDQHAPPRFRVNGSLSTLPEFAEAFACPTGAPMRPATACEVW